MKNLSLRGFSRSQVIGGIALFLVIFAQVFVGKLQRSSDDIQTIVDGSASLTGFTTQKEKQHVPALYLEDSSSEYNAIITDLKQKDSMEMIENPIIERNVVTFQNGDNLCQKFDIDYYEAMSIVNRTHFEIKYDSAHNRQIPIIPIGTEFVIAKRKNGEKIIYENTPEVYCLMTEDELDK